MLSPLFLTSMLCINTFPLAVVLPGLFNIQLPARSHVCRKDNKTSVSDAIAVKALAIPVQTVTLLEGPFKTAVEADAAYLPATEPDRLPADFRSHAGLQLTAERYRGWESPGPAGQTPGHDLSACVVRYASTNDKRLLNEVSHMVGEPAVCQPVPNG